jgi:hypothetical protein
MSPKTEKPVEKTEETAPETKQEAPVDEAAEFETWLAGLPGDTRAKLEAHTSGLKSALSAERKARRELEPIAKEAEKLKAEEAKRQREALSETERLKAELADAQKAAVIAEGKAQSERVRSAIEAKASQLGFADPTDAYAMLDMSQLEYDAQGNPKDVEGALKALATAKPYLVSKPEKATVKSTLNPGGAGAVQETDAERRKRLGW